MAESNEKKTRSSKKKSLIDPLYLKFTKSVIRALGSSDFYDYFMDAISHADNEIQFSNRRMEKLVDRTWVHAIEDALESFQKIIATPRNVIHEEELIVNVANAKKAGADVVQHLAQHASLVEKFDQQSGEVRPSRLMQKYREDSVALYENRLVYTILENAHHFVGIRCEALFGEMSDEFGAKLRLRSDMDSATEHVHMEMFMHIRDVDSTLDADGKHINIFDRISRLHRILSVYMNSPFAQQMARLPRVKGKITKTNVLKKNPNYRAIVKLGEFLQDYDEIGYTINITEQNPVVTEQFQQDIFHNILFNYLVLKGYLERERDRQLPVPVKEKKRALKPKFVKEIIEELTEDYDLPEVEIRKVLIEELTKAQLMQEEAAERRRLVEEQAERKRAEQERIRQEKEAEKERIRKEKEAEKERIRQEKEAQAEQERAERMIREMEDRRRKKQFKKDIELFLEKLPGQLEAREAQAAKEAQEKKDFEDAARLLEEAEQRKQEAKGRERQRRKEEREQKKREALLAQERAKEEERLRLEQERLAREAEEKRIRQENEAKAERIRLAAEAEAEALRQKQTEKAERLRRARESMDAAGRDAQFAKDLVVVGVYLDEADYFTRSLSRQLELREEQAEQARLAAEERERARRQRQAARAGIS